MRGFQNFGANIDPRTGISLFGAIPQLEVFTVNGTWGNPLASGIPARLVTVLVIAGGCAGGQPIVGWGQFAYGGTGGNGGAGAKFSALPHALSASVTVTVGQGGKNSAGVLTWTKAAGVTPPANVGDVAGGLGTTSSFGTYATTTAASSNAYNVPGNVSTATLTGVSGSTSNGGLGNAGTNQGAGPGGASALGGGGGGSGAYFGAGAVSTVFPATAGGNAGAGSAGSPSLSESISSSLNPPYPNVSVTVANGTPGAGSLATALALAQANWTHWLAPQGGGGGGGAGVQVTFLDYCNYRLTAGAGGNGGFAGGGGGGAGLVEGQENFEATSFEQGGAAGSGAQGVVVVLTV